MLFEVSLPADRNDLTATTERTNDAERRSARLLLDSQQAHQHPSQCKHTPLQD